ncbi:MAG TPA: GNAT family N-acetyltransferase [Armatimonadota bacterium]|nr:GNAT family N-acetyltransferase [Armatimonadota bacterium]HOJ20315.1 GNAT family N-acetyltransferase [Armatimonadota bacterium]HOM82064.1 GNAT family N-acetyltransferase [Armatimonadota bacterium]HPO71238.1 GNAT family N-acetyltransferase [Armatimonadota bacterium]
MAAESEKPEFSVAPAAPEDWPWMLRRYERTAWESLTPDLRRHLSPRDVRRQVSAQVEAFRSAAGDSFAALVARNRQGKRAGFIWVQENRHGFTGEARAYVLEVYVSPTCRGKGLGKRLMDCAEEWARARGLERIALNVAAHNTPARTLYESLGYAVETLRMAKELAGGD